MATRCTGEGDCGMPINSTWAANPILWLEAPTMQTISSGPISSSLVNQQITVSQSMLSLLSQPTQRVFPPTAHG